MSRFSPAWQDLSGKFGCSVLSGQETHMPSPIEPYPGWSGVEIKFTVHVALPKLPLNQFKPVMKSRQQELRAYCPNIYCSSSQYLQYRYGAVKWHSQLDDKSSSRLVAYYCAAASTNRSHGAAAVIGFLSELAKNKIRFTI